MERSELDIAQSLFWQWFPVLRDCELSDDVGVLRTARGNWDAGVRPPKLYHCPISRVSIHLTRELKKRLTSKEFESICSDFIFEILPRSRPMPSLACQMDKLERQKRSFVCHSSCTPKMKKNNIKWKSNNTRCN